MVESLNAAVSYDARDEIAVVRIDDGKANAISHAVLEALEAGLDRAETDAGAVVLEGRPGKFSAGFDLSVIQEGPESARALVKRGADLALRLYEFPLPVVVACTGHALAMGAIILMATDVRIAAAGDAKIGLNEVAIGMPVPLFAVELARDRLSKRHFGRAVNLATIYGPSTALDVGFLDEVVEADAVASRARTEAQRLAEGLHRGAFVATRENVRGARAREIRSVMDADIAKFTVG